VGYFAECDEKVRSRLRDTRAELYIAENERKLAVEKLKVCRMETPEFIVREMIRVTAMVSTLEKQTKDKKIGGWAKTVGESLTRSVAESAPSSVPSLESVGYDVSFGESALKSAGGAPEQLDADRELMRIRYEMAVRAIEKHYAELDSYDMEHERQEIRAVKKMYAAVAYTEAERVELDVVEKISHAMGRSGLGNHVVCTVFEEAGVPYHGGQWN